MIDNIRALRASNDNIINKIRTTTAKNDVTATSTEKTTVECQTAQRRFVSVMAVDDHSRIEPLTWSGATLSTTLTMAFTVKMPRNDEGMLLLWAARKVSRPMFLVSHLTPTRRVRNAVDMERHLSDEARRLVDTPNAGGNSALSEAMSMDFMKAVCGARLERAEMEIDYWCVTKITDYSMSVCNQPVIGVSVTRACAFRGKFTLADAENLLRKKLYGINESTKHVITPHAWKRQVLHIFVQRASIADMLAYAYARLPLELRNDTLVLCTVTNERWVFFGDDK